MKTNYIANSVIGSISSSHNSSNSSNNSNSSNSSKRYDDDNYNDISISNIRKSHSLNNLGNSNSINGLNCISSSSKQSNNSPLKSIRQPVRLLPPLPLQEFQIDPKSLIANTITGNKIKNINHNINDTNKDDDYYNESECTVTGNLHDPFISRKLQKYFTYSDRMETKIYEDLKKYIVYICPSFSNTDISLLNCNDDNDKVKLTDRICLSKLPCLTFNSEFECGNIDVVQLVESRDISLIEKSLERVSKDRDFQLPIEVQQEYDITIRNDINTKGNIQWYYFSVNSGNYGSSSELNTSGKNWTYPAVIRFNITNFSKSDSLYNYGMRPVVYSTKQFADSGKSWNHDDTSDICYYQNRMESNSNKGKKRQYTLTFTYTFTGPDLVYFAHCYPYTFSDHLRYMTLLEEDKKISKFMRRRLLCNTILGNRCDLITITNRGSSVEELKARSAIVITARVHPGESNASYMMHGFIKFLTSHDPAAIALRNNFVFKIIPMLNPDGVIHGNYRCSMMGTDLNRRYRDDNPIFHPTITALKNLLKQTHEDRGVLLYLDLHGHSKKKNAFVYGCDTTLQSENLPSTGIILSNEEKMMQRIYTRIFPTILCSISNKDSGGYFSSADSSYKVQKSKKGTARVVSWRDIGIEGAYTIEASFCSNGDNNERRNINQAFKNESFRNDDDDNSINSNVSDKMLFVSANAESLRLSYQHVRHYTRNDYLKMGQDIAMSIFKFANLEGEASSNTVDSTKVDETNNFDDEVDDNAGSSTLYGGFKENSYTNTGYLVKISYNNYDKCTRPMLRPAIFSSEAIEKAINNATVFQKCFRIQCEIYLRKQFGNPDKSFDVNPRCANLIDTRFGTLEDEGDEGSIGSDSDPSVDNTPQKNLISAKDIKKIKNNNILNFFLKSTIRRLKENYERSMESEGTTANVTTTNNNKSSKSSKITVRQLNRKSVTRTSYQFKSINPSQDTADDYRLKSDSSEQNSTATKEQQHSPLPGQHERFDYEDLHWSEKHYSSYKNQLKSGLNKLDLSHIKPDYAFLMPTSYQGNMRDSLLFPNKSTSSITGITPFAKLGDNSSNYNNRNSPTNTQQPLNNFQTFNDGYSIGNDYGNPNSFSKFNSKGREKTISPSIELFSKEKAGGGRNSPINVFEAYTNNQSVQNLNASNSLKKVSGFESKSNGNGSTNLLKKETTLTDFFRAMGGASVPLPSSSIAGLAEDKEFIACPKMYSPDSPVPVPQGYQKRLKNHKRDFS